MKKLLFIGIWGLIFSTSINAEGGLFDYYNKPCEVPGINSYIQKVKKDTYIGGGISFVDYLDLFIEKYGSSYSKDEQVDIKRNMIVEYYLVSDFIKFNVQDIKFDIENQISVQDGLKFYKSQQLPLQNLYKIEIDSITNVKTIIKK